MICLACSTSLRLLNATEEQSYSNILSTSLQKIDSMTKEMSGLKVMLEKLITVQPSISSSAKSSTSGCSQKRKNPPKAKKSSRPSKKTAVSRASTSASAPRRSSLRNRSQTISEFPVLLPSNLDSPAAVSLKTCLKRMDELRVSSSKLLPKQVKFNDLE